MADCTLQESRREFTKRYKTHPGSKSKTWKYFGFLVDNTGGMKVTLDEAICELCDKQVNHSINTTNLLMHLKCHCIIEYNEVISVLRSAKGESSEEQEQGSTNANKAKQQNLVDMISKKEPYKKNHSRDTRCVKSFVMIYSQLALLTVQCFANCCIHWTQDFSRVLTHSLAE